MASLQQHDVQEEGQAAPPQEQPPQEQQRQQQQQQPPQEQQQRQQQQQQQPAWHRGWAQRALQALPLAVKAVLALELVATVLAPLARPQQRGRSRGGGSSSDSGSDPADALVDYLAGRRPLAALQVLSPKQLRQAVDHLVTEDYAELGISDRGAELRGIVQELIDAKENPAARPPPPQEQRVGLGQLGPLRMRTAAKATPAGRQGERPAAAGAGDAAPPGGGGRV